MSEFIEIPIETDHDILAQDGFDFIQSQFPNWVPNDGNLETVMIEANALMTAEARDVASAVPVDIFRTFGKLVDILPREATPARATVAMTMIDNAGYTVPAGTQLGIVTSGDESVPFTTDIDAIVAPGATVITGVPITALDPGIEASGLPDTSVVILLDTLDFVTLVDLETITTGGENAEEDDVYLNRLATRLQVMTQHPILAPDFAIFAQDIIGVSRAVALDGYNPDHNLVTPNQSSVETDTTGFVAGTNCSISRDTTQAADGVANLRMSSVAAGDMNALLTPITQYIALPGQQFTALASFRAAVSARSCRVELFWYDPSQLFISQTNGIASADTTTGFTQVTVTGAAPGNAAYVRVSLRVLATGGAGEVHFVDKIALKHNSNTLWKIGGTPEFNNERQVSVAVVDSSGLPVSAGIKTQVDNYLESLREVNFLVEVIDPLYTIINVTFVGVAKPGFVAADVETACEAAVADWLSPANWGLPEIANLGDTSHIVPLWINTTVIRYLELATALNAVNGLDYLTTLTFGVQGGSLGTTDINLGGATPLPLPGVINGTVTAP